MTSIPPSTPVMASPAAAVALVKPNVGGIYEGIPFTGGLRDIVRTFPLCPYMDRDRNTKMKVYKAWEKGIKEEFQLKKSVESNMHSFKPEVMSILKSYGLDSFFYMIKNGQYVFMLETLDALSISEIRVQEAAFRKACNYDNQNLYLGKLFLKNSIDPSIRKLLHYHIQSTDGSVSYYNILCNHVLGQENTKLKLYQRIILDTKLTDFAGLNITNYH